MSSKNAIIGTVALVAALAVYAFIEDLSGGLTFFYSARSWLVWGVGLVLLGAAGVIFESAYEWVFAEREYAQPPPRRVLRAAAAAVVIIVIVAAMIFMAPLFTTS